MVISADTTNDNKLPEELTTDILVRLPVKSLLRHRAVSNPWLSLISSPSFINSHLRHTIAKSDDDDNFILRGDDDSMSLIHLSSDQIPGIDLELPFWRGELPFVPGLAIIGSHNGIVCVAVSDYPRLDMHDRDFYQLCNPRIYLWNPATKHSKLISPQHTIHTSVVLVCHGFGFDSIANDFKVVRVVSVLQSPNKLVDVYSANDNVWRVVEPGPVNVPFDYIFCVCVKGFLCSLGYDNLITFDLNKEVFNCSIKLPFVVRRYRPCVTEFKGSVAVIDFNKDEESDYAEAHNSNSKITLWRLDDACLRGGTEGSWTVMFSVDVAFTVDFVRCYLNNGDILLHTRGNNEGWSLYNPHKKESKPVQASIGRGRIFKYTESLVSIRGFKQVRRNAHADGFCCCHWLFKGW